MSINDFLVYLTGTGCLVAASWILGQFAKYQALADTVKQWIFFGVASVLALASWAVTVYVPASIINSFATPFGIVAAVFIAVFINKLYMASLSAAKK